MLQSATYDERDFIKFLTNNVLNSFETTHPVSTENIIHDLRKCNPKTNFRDMTKVRKFTLCFPHFYYISLYGGLGYSKITNADERTRRAQIIKGSSPYVGGTATYYWKVNTLIKLEGRYWLLPNFQDDETAFENLRTSSVVEGSLAFQRRFFKSDWSYRVGAIGYKVPVMKNLSASVFALDALLRLRNTIMGGLFVGLKYAPDRVKGGKHLLYSDVAAVGYSDNRFLNEWKKSYLLKAGYKYFFKMPFVFNIELENLRFYSKQDEKLSTFFVGAGVQWLLF